MKTGLTLAQTKISFSLIIDKYSKSIIRMCLPTGNCGWTDKMCVDTMLSLIEDILKLFTESVSVGWHLVAVSEMRCFLQSIIMANVDFMCIRNHATADLFGLFVVTEVILLKQQIQLIVMLIQTVVSYITQFESYHTLKSKYI